MKSLITILAIIPMISAWSPPYQPKCDQCIPTPDKNQCDITTSCTYVWGHTDPNTPGPQYCACRHGYRATGYDAADMTVQWRLPWTGGANGPSQQGRVFVKPGVKCDTLCDDWTAGKDGCRAVQEKSWCM